MTIAKLIAKGQHEIISCTVTATVEEAARLMADRRIGALPVYEGSKIVGIFSERDLLYSISKDGANALQKRVGEVMTAPAITVDPDSEILEALALMTRRRVRHLPVERDGQVQGFISIGDLVKHRVELAETEAEQLRQYIQTA